MKNLVEIEKKIPEKELKSVKLKIKLKRKSLQKTYLHVNSGPGFIKFIEYIKSVSDKLIRKYTKPKTKRLSLFR